MCKIFQNISIYISNLLNYYITHNINLFIKKFMMIYSSNHKEIFDIKAIFVNIYRKYFYNRFLFLYFLQREIFKSKKFK